MYWWTRRAYHKVGNEGLSIPPGMLQKVIMSDEIAQKVGARFKVAEFHLEAMSNLRPKSTGVEGTIIWISAGEFSGSESQHGPRIKVVLGDKATKESLGLSVSVRLTDPPVVLGELPGRVKKQVLKFVEKNRETLLQHWNGELDSKETLDLLEKV